MAELVCKAQADLDTYLQLILNTKRDPMCAHKAKCNFSLGMFCVFSPLRGSNPAC